MVLRKPLRALRAPRREYAHSRQRSRVAQQGRLRLVHKPVSSLQRAEQSSGCKATLPHRIPRGQIAQGPDQVQLRGLLEHVSAQVDALFTRALAARNLCGRLAVRPLMRLHFTFVGGLRRWPRPLRHGAHRVALLAPLPLRLRRRRPGRGGGGCCTLRPVFRRLPVRRFLWLHFAFVCGFRGWPRPLRHGGHRVAPLTPLPLRLWRRWPGRGGGVCRSVGTRRLALAPRNLCLKRTVLCGTCHRLAPLLGTRRPALALRNPLRHRAR
mmetsp:Transcript_70575/g.197962  ORF Transcript_70575/g.197962 Transcript_70575/m.197962 type:complete len:267 (+) Transcript_70575:204-1004(+)